MNLPPSPTIPTLAVFRCPTCGKQSVAESGNKIMCQECVNQFLAKNVGLMEELVAEPAEEQAPVQ